MIDSICEYIPSWKAASEDLREIRSDVVSSLNNINTILKQLLQQNSTAPFDNINQFILEQRNEYKEEVEKRGINEELLNQLYYLIMNYSTYSSTEEKLKIILNTVNQLLSQLHISSFKDIFVQFIKNRLKNRMK